MRWKIIDAKNHEFSKRLHPNVFLLVFIIHWTFANHIKLL